ncbi:DoxX family membrane protein [Mucilaginibacter pallidiroseus]|uniref:DoxX family membrane protein n=1 Tax=Mucilaginibacter pallidiroseus TaxID=2599295 RepID=A0A563UG88_9SPHI|nr:DoxX family membrane protein [Mucilaginibacter pallidiroseus]TWR30368.1 DoxX family membrane protein [Mucilaginibacter pallidiroseus]
MKATVLASRIILGLLYLIFGLDYFFKFIPYQPPLHPGAAGAFKAGLMAAGYFYPMQKTIQILGGLALLSNRFAPLAAVVLFPISLNVFLFHTLLAPEAWQMGVLLLLPNLLLGWGYRKYYAGVFTVKAVV